MKRRNGKEILSEETAEGRPIFSVGSEPALGGVPARSTISAAAGILPPPIVTPHAAAMAD
jgi:hypothetical protein